jgi:hypothetical protein
MMSQLHRLLATVLVFTLVATVAPDAPGPKATSDEAPLAQEAMPDSLMSAFLAASSQPLAPNGAVFGAHSGGLDVTLDPTGLQANVSGIAWHLALRALGREGHMTSLPDAQIAQADGRLDYDRGVLTEWYRDTALGMEQGFTIQQPPGGRGPLALHLDLSTNLTGTADTDGRGLSFTTPNGQTLRYDHLRAWDADGVPLEARLQHLPGYVGLHVNDQGAIYPITIDPLIYVERQVTASDGESDDWFGYSVGLYGDTALVGAPNDDVDATYNQGSAYVFTRSGVTWSEQQRLTASDGAAGDGFGWSVALWENTALVGARNDDVGTAWDQGSAYIFARSGTIWSEQAHLTASNGTPEDLFGSSVALWEDTALVGVPCEHENQGSAYVFLRGGTTWSEQAHLLASDGAAGDRFGWSVALWENAALVGAYGDAVGANGGQGSAYVFLRSETTWSEQAHLTASDGEADDHLGWSVALWGDTALVGAEYDSVDAHFQQGSAYVFARYGTSWSEQARLVASDGQAWDHFGGAVALWGDTAVVGAYWHDVGLKDEQGAAYIFGRSGAAWVEQQKLLASDGEQGDHLGCSVALWGNTALVGAFYDDVGATDSQGSAHLFDALPAIISIAHADPSPTHASSVDFAVVFSEDVTGVDVSDFAPSTTGSITGTEVIAVVGSAATYTVTVSTGSGMGTLRLDVPASAIINDLAGNPLSDLPYTSGEAYTIAYVTYLPLVLRTVP